MSQPVDTEAASSRFRRPVAMFATFIVLVALGALGFAAFGDEAENTASFAEYVAASAAVLELNGFGPASDIDCSGSTESDEMTCTGTTTEGFSVESTGENVGRDNATLTVKVDGQVLYDGLLDDVS